MCLLNRKMSTRRSDAIIAENRAKATRETVEMILQRIDRLEHDQAQREKRAIARHREVMTKLAGESSPVRTVDSKVH